MGRQTIWLGLLGIWMALLAGCAQPAQDQAPALPVYFGTIDPAQKGLWLVPLTDNSFTKPEVRVSIAARQVEISLLLVNCTGRDILVHHDLADTLRYIDVSAKLTREGGESQWVPPSYAYSAQDYPYLLLKPAELKHWPHGPFPKQPSESAIDILFCVPLPPGTRFADVEFDWGLSYYVPGATKRGFVRIRKSMRVLVE